MRRREVNQIKIIRIHWVMKRHYLLFGDEKQFCCGFVCWTIIICKTEQKQTILTLRAIIPGSYRKSVIAASHEGASRLTVSVKRHSTTRAWRMPWSELCLLCVIVFVITEMECSHKLCNWKSKKEAKRQLAVLLQHELSVRLPFCIFVEYM